MLPHDDPDRSWHTLWCLRGRSSTSARSVQGVDQRRSLAPIRGRIPCRFKIASSTSTVELEPCLLDITSQIGSRGVGVERGGVETFMASSCDSSTNAPRCRRSQASAKDATRAVGIDFGPGQSRPTDQSRDNVLHRADQHGRKATRSEHRSFGLRCQLLFEQLTQGPAGRRVQRHLTFLEVLAVPYQDHPGPPLLKRPRQAFGPQRQVEARLERMSRHTAKPFRKPRGMTVITACVYFGTARGRIPHCVRPLDGTGFSHGPSVAVATSKSSPD